VSKGRATFFFRNGPRLAIALASLVLSAAWSIAWIQSIDGDLSGAERWAWSQISQGLPADFNAHCGQLDSQKGDDPRWADPRGCRTLSGGFLARLFTKPSFHDAITYRGVEVFGARIVGDVNLSFTRIDRPLRTQNSRFEHTISLSYAYANSPVDFAGSNIAGILAAYVFRSESSLGLSRAKLDGGVALSYASIGMFLDLSTSTCKDDLDTTSLQVGGSLLMGSDGANKASFKNVILRSAKVAGQINLTGASVDGDMDANSLQVGGSLLMGSDGANKASFKNVILRSAKVTDQINLTGANIDGVLEANSLQVGGSLLMVSDGANKASFKNVILRSAKVTDQINLTGASVDGDMDANSLQVGASLLMVSDGANKASFKNVTLRSAKVAGQINLTGASVDGALDGAFLQVDGPVLAWSDETNKASFGALSFYGARVAGNLSMDRALLRGSLWAPGLRVGGDISFRDLYTDAPIALPFVQLGGNLDFSGADLSSLDLSGASIAGEMRLGDHKSVVVGWFTPNGGEESIDLRNAHVGSLVDNKLSWPKHLHLYGFTFARLGAEATKRGINWWDGWARLDDDQSATQYEQLANAFAGLGDHDTVDAIHYAERARAQEKTSGLAFVWSSALRWAAGYGIGTYMFRALGWAFALAALGALILRFSVKGVRAPVEGIQKHGMIWCFGASVNRLLPVLSLKKEFVDFFDDPKLNQFKPWQDFLFVALAVLGWVLGAIVIAAFATITHGS
jgi:uncharacterized protein YjbI with pentapeptide repeats